MTSKTFQPLLFDNFLFKLPNTTYVDHYGVRDRKRFLNLNRNYKSLTQQEKMALLQKRARPFTTTGAFKNEAPKHPHSEFITNDKFFNSQKVHVNFDPRVSVKEITQRGSSSASAAGRQVYLDSIDQSNNQKLFSPPPFSTKEQVVYPKTPYPRNSINDQELSNLTKVLNIEDEQNIEIVAKKKPENYHWMVYKQEEMPNYILEAKKRLGMIKQPHIAPNIEPKKHQQTEAHAQAQAFAPATSPAEEPSTESKKSGKHWQIWDNPSTPDKIKEIRARLGDDRYKKLQRAKSSLSNYETKFDNNYTTTNSTNFNQRPKTSFEIKTQTNNQNLLSSDVKVTTTVTVNENEAAALAQALEPYHIPSQNEVEPKTYASYFPAGSASSHLPLSAVSTNYFDLPNPSIIHTTATTLPPFIENYAQPQQQQQQPQSYTNNELSALQKVYDNDSFMVNAENQFISEGKNENENENEYYYVNNNSRAENREATPSSTKATYTIADNSNPAIPFEAWMQTASEKDKTAILNILRKIDNAKIDGSKLSNEYMRVKLKKSSKNGSARSGGRNSTTPAPHIRKLGTTRHLIKFPSEKHEKQYIKQHLWENYSAENRASLHFGYPN